MKRVRWLMMLMPALLVSCNYGKTTSQIIKEEIDVPKSYEYYEVFEYELTWDSIFDPSNDKYYVYFYSSTCSHCDELKNYIIEKALQRGDIYFVKGSSKDQITNDSKKTIGAENPENIWILGYPSLLLISNHKCTKNMAGTSQIKAEIK